MSKMNSAISGAGAGAAVGGPWGAAIGGALGFLGGKDDNSNDTYDQMMRQAQNIPLPVLKEYYPDLYKQVVSLNPQMESAVSQGPSEMAGVATDPALRQAQLKALGKLSSVGEAGGRDAQFMSDQNRLESNVNADESGREGAIQQSLAARGMGGGMSELVQRNLESQQGANREAQMGMDLNAQAQQRALQSLSQSGQLAGQMQGQDFSQQSAKAQAADSIARFNAQNSQSVQHSNVANSNQAQQWNATNAQNTANTNTQNKNEAQQYNISIPQQQYDNQMKKYGLYSGAASGMAQNQARQAGQQDQFMGGMMDSAGRYASAQSKAPGQVEAGDPYKTVADDDKKKWNYTA